MTSVVSPVQQSYAEAVAAFDCVIKQVSPADWTLPTPCSDWDVRALVNHVVGEACWTPPLLAGRTIADIGDRFSGDLLGADPLAAWTVARQAATDAVARAAIAEALVDTSAGTIPAVEFVHQLTADHLVHSWDLAVAIGADQSLDPALVDTVAEWFTAHAEEYRAAGASAAEASVPADAEPQRRLLAAFGRDAQECTSAAAVARFSTAFDRHDLDAIMAAMTENCLFESTEPPDGAAYRGQYEVRAAWADFFASSPEAHFTTEEQFTCGDRVVVSWRYDFPTGHVRGVDLFRVQDGLVAEKRSYVKG
jgi:uncharacterized protein (TIGR03086 family)